ncbi:ABC transporter permease [Amycolatopsis sp. NPDC051061]|uniref:ABC transporter permease n=1 Tax=Amycolatopsis sp. NPDC051061 TaxID=3155042 RepID=UPI00343A61C5
MTRTPAVATPAKARLTFAGVVRSEWVKLRSLRSSALSLAGAAVILIAVGLIFAATFGSDSDGANGVTEPTGVTLTGGMFAQLIVGVLGVLSVSSEYSTGMIRSTLTAVPSRVPVLAGKVVVVAMTVFPVMLASAFVVFFAGQALMSGNGHPSATLADPGVLGALLGSAVTMTGVAIMGLASGTLMRNTAAAISTLVALVFLVPGLGSLVLPASWRDDVLKFLPSNASDAFTSISPAANLLGAGGGAAVFAAWVVVPLLAAAVLLRRRDV